MSQFMVLVYDNPSVFADLTPQQMQQVIQEYGAWAGKLAKEGCLVGGEKLTHEGGKIIRSAGKQVKGTDGPYSETKEVLGGYIIIKADDYSQAVEISKTCPAVKYGPRIDVRQVDPIKG